MNSYPSSIALAPTEIPLTERVTKVQSQPVTLKRAIASEWVKFRTLRSSWAILAAAVLAMLVFGVVIGLDTRHLTGHLEASDIAPSGPLQGYNLAELILGALGVLFVAGEYGTGMIHSTLTAVPKRIPVLWAKLIVFAAIAAVAMIAVSFVAFFAGQAVISGTRPAYSLASHDALRVVIGTGVYLTLIGVIGMSLGWIVRNTAGALVSLVGLTLVLPILFGDALGTWGKHIAEYLPTEAGKAFSTTGGGQYSLSPWVGLAVMAAWAVIGIAVAYYVLRRRDA